MSAPAEREICRIGGLQTPTLTAARPAMAQMASATTSNWVEHSGLCFVQTFPNFFPLIAQFDPATL
ncbi:MAG: hypothetical protein C4K60_14635 [Ideonella sp. MAG2]|nr:MAG: hypothetical protein C4K60_14635 [Ideonella sp. MAG2]